LLGISVQATAADCTREVLGKAAEAYVAAQSRGEPKVMTLASSVKYIENGKAAKIGKGILTNVLHVDFHRSLLDTETCQTFTEMIITDPAHPYVIGTRLKVTGGRIGEIESLVTDQGDWLFSAKNDLKYSPNENWGPIPKDKLDDRKTLLAAANAYFDLFNDKSVQVPWNTPCNRLEGGLRTGKGTLQDSCLDGVPSGVELTNRRFVVDEQIGAVVGFVDFGKSKRPDAHLFRLDSGRIRYIHTITVCEPDANCGFKLPDELKDQQ
jgi:hypothetical protein